MNNWYSRMVGDYISRSQTILYPLRDQPVDFAIVLKYD